MISLRNLIRLAGRQERGIIPRSRRGRLAIVLVLLLLGAQLTPVGFAPVGTVKADTNAGIVQEETSPSPGTELKTGETYEFDVRVYYELDGASSGEVKLYFEGISDGPEDTVTVNQEDGFTTVSGSLTVPDDWNPNNAIQVSVTTETTAGGFDADTEEYPVTSSESNEPPSIDDVDPADSPIEITRGGSISFSADASDPDGDSLSYDWYLNDLNSDSGLQHVASGSSYTQQFDELSEYTVRIRVNDGTTTVEESWVVAVVKENQDRTPTISRVTPGSSSVSVDRGASKVFEVEVTDQDQDLDVVEWYVDGGKEHTRHLGGGSPQTDDWEYTFQESGTHNVEALVIDENGNQDTVSWTVEVDQPARPDLEVTDVEWRPESPSAGEEIEFRLTVTNTGEVAADTIEMEVRVDGSAAAVPPTKDLGPGETETTPWTGSYEIAEGSHEIRGIIDPDDHIEESDESNNDHPESIGVDDSTGYVEGQVLDGNGDPISGAKVYLDDTTDKRADSNGYYSFQDVPEGEHELYVTAGACFETRTLDVSVERGETTTRDFHLDGEEYEVRLASEPVEVATDGEGTYTCGNDVRVEAPEEGGNYRFQAWEDNSGSVVSNDPSFSISHITRNYDLTAVYATAGTPDLVVDEIRWRPSDPAEGDQVTLHVDVQNVGGARVSSTDVEVSIDGNVYRINDLTLEAGEIETLSIHNAWTASSSTGTVNAEVDYKNEVEEGDESNNRESSTIQVRTPTATTTQVQTTTQTPTRTSALPETKTVTTPTLGAVSVDVVVEGRATVWFPGLNLEPRQLRGGETARFEEVPVGRHIVKVRSPSTVGGARSTTVTVREGETTRVEFDIETDASIRGQVTRSDGSDVDEGTVRVAGTETAIAEGTFEFSNRVRPDTYAIEVVLDGEVVQRDKVQVTAGENIVTLEVPQSSGGGGFEILDNAQKGAIMGEVGLQLGLESASTPEYLAGWLGFSIVPIADAPADIRDCVLAPNADWGSNALDCGGAAVSTAGSVGTIIGAITSPSGGGAVLALGSFSIDTAEDVTDAATIFVKWVRHFPEKIDEAVRILTNAVGGAFQKVVDEIEDPSLHRKALRHFKASQLGISTTDIARIAEKNGDVRRTIRATKTSDESVVWLEKGRLSEDTRRASDYVYDEGGSGWAHIRNNHVDKPSGNDFIKFGDEYREPENIKDLIITAVEEGRRVERGDATWYVHRTDEGPVSVLVGNNGYIVTARPGSP